MRQKPFIIVRGGGDLATGTIHRLWAAGFPVLVLETDHPAAIRRQVAVCEAVYEGSATVEGMEAVLIKDTAEAKKVIDTGKVPLIVDPDGASITALKPDVVVDAILAKKNLGTNRSMAPLTVGLGPGFTAGVDVDIVIETMRGHNLGRIIREGSAIPNTGIPGNIGGYTAERVIHAGAEGIHGLNDTLTNEIPEDAKYRIYVSALNQINLDEHNRIPSSDGRLLRRIVRDAMTRGNDARETISRWDSVRKGEEDNIFPYQEEADVMFNSAQIYEIAVLKQHAEPLLFAVPKDCPEYQEAKRLLKFLEYFLNIPSEAIPKTSLLREFIGGSCFDV